MPRCFFLTCVCFYLLTACNSDSNPPASNTPDGGSPLPDDDSGAVLCDQDCDIPDYLPEVAPLEGIEATVRGDTALVSFEGIAAGKDYRIYSLPTEDDVVVDNGTLTIRNAIYRCGGDRPLTDEIDASISGEVHFYNRSESESLLGYVFLFEGEGRLPVFMLGDPSPASDSIYGPVFDAERVRLYTTDVEERDRLIGEGWRDDGIAFYVPSSEGANTTTLYRYESFPQEYSQNRVFVLLMTQGTEYQQRNGDDDAQPMRALFPILTEQEQGSVPLYRVLYGNANIHDVLAAGEARYQRVLNQGNSPIWELQWPGLTEKTTLIIEALDNGCPFQAFLAPQDHEAVDHLERFATIETLASESESGEVFVNGQFDSTNRPEPIARAAVVVRPAEEPDMDWFEGFTQTIHPDQFTLIDSDGNNGHYHWRSENWDVDFSETHNPVRLFGTMQGEFWVGFADRSGGVNGRFRLAPLQMAEVTSDSFLHVRMETDIPSTGRRYPQLMVSTVEPPIQRNLEQGQTVILQTFGDETQVQLQYCDHRTWDVNDQCPRVSPYGRDLDDYDDGSSPWAPIHSAAEFSGFDRRVRFDLFLSTTHAYVLLEGQPYSCSVLPGGGLPAGEVSVNFGTVLYHSGIDEGIIYGPHRYLERHGYVQTNRHFDNLGFESGATLPQWNEHVPCVDGVWAVRE